MGQEAGHQPGPARGVSSPTPSAPGLSMVRGLGIRGHWYGIKRYFEWLESRAYKMHVRVLLSRYRAYTPCDACNGARLRTYGVLWRVGDHALAESTLGGRSALPAPRRAVEPGNLGCAARPVPA